MPVMLSGWAVPTCSSCSASCSVHVAPPCSSCNCSCRSSPCPPAVPSPCSSAAEDDCHRRSKRAPHHSPESRAALGVHASAAGRQTRWPASRSSGEYDRCRCGRGAQRCSVRPAAQRCIDRMGRGARPSPCCVLQRAGLRTSTPRQRACVATASHRRRKAEPQVSRSGVWGHRRVLELSCCFVLARVTDGSSHFSAPAVPR